MGNAHQWPARYAGTPPGTEFSISDFQEYGLSFNGKTLSRLTGKQRQPLQEELAASSDKDIAEFQWRCTTVIYSGINIDCSAYGHG